MAQSIEIKGTAAQKRDIIAKVVGEYKTEPSALRAMSKVLALLGGYGSPKEQAGSVEGKTFRVYFWESGKLGPVALVTGPQIVTEVVWGDTLGEQPRGMSATLGGRVTRASRQSTREAVSAGREDAREIIAETPPAKRFWGGTKEMRPGGQSYDLPHVRHRGTAPQRVWKGPRTNPSTEYIAPLGSRLVTQGGRYVGLPQYAESYAGEEFTQEGYEGHPVYSDQYPAPAYEPPVIASGPDYSGASPQSLLEGVLSGDEYAMAEIRRRLSLKGKSAIREQMKGFLQALPLDDANQLRAILPAGHAIGKYLPVEATPVYVAPAAPVYEAAAPAYVAPAPAPAMPSAEEGRAAAIQAAQQLAAAFANLGDE